MATKTEDIEELITALRAAGMNISKRCETLRDVVIAVESGSGSGGEPIDDDDEETDPTDEASPLGNSGEPPMLMSTTGTDKPKRGFLHGKKITKRQQQAADAIAGVAPLPR